MSLLRTTAAEIIQSLQSKKVSSVEVTTEYLDHIQAHDGKIQAFLHVDRAAALAAAKAIDDRRAAGKTIGKLAGLPVAIKDVICTQGVWGGGSVGLACAIPGRVGGLARLMAD